MLRRAVPLVLAPALACGPSLARLERGHHYDEAICGVAERAFSEGQVATVIRRALDPALHVAAVPREQLAAALGDDAPELQRVVLLRISHDSNTIPLQEFSVTFALRGDVSVDLNPTGSPQLAAAPPGDGKSVDLKPTGLPQLAAVFQEHVPGPRTVGPGAIESAAHTIGTVGAVILTVASLGILGGLLRGRGSGPRSRTEYPTEEEIRRAAPRAARLYDAVAHLQSPCPNQPGARCHTLALVPRPPDESADLALGLELRYGARHGSACSFASVRETLEIALPPGPTLEARLAAVFGADMRRLSALPTR